MLIWVLFSNVEDNISDNVQLQRFAQAYILILTGDFITENVVQTEEYFL